MQPTNQCQGHTQVVQGRRAAQEFSKEPDQSRAVLVSLPARREKLWGTKYSVQSEDQCNLDFEAASVEAWEEDRVLVLVWLLGSNSCLCCFSVCCTGAGQLTIQPQFPHL
jgi:hypothetical protein